MPEIEFSVTPSTPEESTAFHQAMAEFEAQTRIKVRLLEIDPADARDALIKFSVQPNGPDISQLGSTWLRDLVDMNGLRPFKPSEVKQIGSRDDFIPASWKSALLSDYQEMCAIPWMADVSVLYYRRDILKAAGIDEKAAFTNLSSFENAIERLKACGVEIPWVVPTRRTWVTMHNVASWVWGSGGEFVSPDGKEIRFDRPEAMNGIKAYINLVRFMPEKARGLTLAESDALFKQGKAAITLTGPWLLQMDEQALQQVGVSAPPGPPFVGGSHLVVWKHTPFARETIRLIQYLTSLPYQRKYARAALFPVRLSAFDTLNVGNREFGKYLREGLVNGRSFPSIYLWGMVEDRLNNTINDIWEEVQRQPNLDLDKVVKERFAPLAKRLNLILNK